MRIMEITRIYMGMTQTTIQYITHAIEQNITIIVITSVPIAGRYFMEKAEIIIIPTVISITASEVAMIR